MTTAIKPIWRVPATPEQLMERSRNTLAEHLGIRITEIGPDYLRATMPVNSHTHQPNGILHGGASVALAETVGSLAANFCVDITKYVCVGQEINANHLRPVASGLVTATARPFHIGGKSQVWGIEIRDGNDKPRSNASNPLGGLSWRTTWARAARRVTRRRWMSH
jgi:1,4-dihydroxy-2-naphthoyl-CoA hydrolase